MLMIPSDPQWSKSPQIEASQKRSYSIINTKISVEATERGDVILINRSCNLTGNPA
jgi:hypothetical protein